VASHSHCFPSNAIVVIPMVLNGDAGARYGINFPVFSRASFGLRGANIPALLRAVVACGWFGIQTWIGASGSHIAANIVSPANDFANLVPSIIDFKRGGYLTGVFGALIFLGN